MNFCSHCGHPVELKIPPGDNRARHVCTECHTIHYQNPNIVAGTIPVYKGRVLLCQRDIEPRRGYWTLPAGFMENQESAEEAAIRETREEAMAQVRLISLFSLLSVPQIDQVHLFFLAELTDEYFGPGEETLDCRLFDESDVPWDEIAFPTVKKTLQRYFEDRKADRLDGKTFVDNVRRPSSASRHQ